MRLNPTAVVVVCWLVSAMVAGAQSPKPLTDIGREPFTGSHVEACKLHAAADQGLSLSQCLTALKMADDESVCAPKAVLTEGSVWRMLFTDHQTGEHRLGLAVIAFGDDVPADHPTRMGNDCTGVTGGLNFVKPDACGNYSQPVPMSVPQAAAPKQREYAVTGSVTTFVTDVIPFPLTLGGNSCCVSCCCDVDDGLEVHAGGAAHRRTITTVPLPAVPGSETPYGEYSPYDYD